MKRCPTDAGGCGELVDLLFNSGLCQKCDAQVAKGTAAVGGTPRRRAGRRKLVAAGGTITEEPPREACAKYVKGEERGICGTCGAKRSAHGKPPGTEARRLAATICKQFVAGDEPGICARCGISRGTHYGKPNEQPPVAPASPQMALERLRSAYSEEHAAATALANAWLAKLEVLDEIEAEMKAQ